MYTETSTSMVCQYGTSITSMVHQYGTIIISITSMVPVSPVGYQYDTSIVHQYGTNITSILPVWHQYYHMVRRSVLEVSNKPSPTGLVSLLLYGASLTFITHSKPSPSLVDLAM